MKFMSRGLIGLTLIIMTGGFLLAAVYVIRSSYSDDDEGRGFRGGSRERIFAVDVREVTLQSATPIISTFGEIVSGRTLELRAASSGALVHLADGFRDGGTVRAGELLFQTDPAASLATQRLNQTLLTEAQSERIEADAAIILAQDELAAAERQLGLRNDALARQKKLRARGVGTEATLETALLSASTAEQAILSKRQSLANAKARINRAQTSFERAKINLDEAQRKLDDTRVVAGFDGALIDVTAVAGGLVNANERLGRLIDPSALEVSVRLSSEEYARMSNEEGILRAANVEVQFSSIEDPIKGTIDRVSAAVGEGQTGRAVFATLQSKDAKFLRVGDFVTVIIAEPSLDNVAVIPTSASSSVGEVLIVGDDDRIQSASVKILRQQADTLIVDPSEIVGEKLILKRAPQLGVGIRVRPNVQGEPVQEVAKTVKLSPELQAQITTYVSANAYIPQDAKDRILKATATGEITRKMYDRMADRAGLPDIEIKSAKPKDDTTEEMVALSQDQRSKMIAFVQANKRMPEDAKERVLKQLEEPEISKKMYDRLLKNMGS